MNDLLLQLLRGEIPFLCQLPDGQLLLRTSFPPAILTGSFNPLHDGHLRLGQAAAQRLNAEVHFELTIRNADKPSLAVDEAQHRMRQFLGVAPLWLTQAATFAERAKLFPGTVWIVGADTAERILQPRFYQNDISLRDAALAQIRECGCRFLVAGRTDSSGRFQSLKEMEIPGDFWGLFDEIGEAEFRMDVSSSQIRQSEPGPK